MNRLDRDGIALMYNEYGRGKERPMLFVHGWGSDHTYFAPQQLCFGAARRTVAIDLRGHGASDAPHQTYSVVGLAEDLAWQCRKLDLITPLLVGHSMGGQIILECAARYPDLVGAVVLIDSVLFPPAALRDQATHLAGALDGPNYISVLPHAADLFFLPSDDPTLKSRFIRSMAATPQHVLVSTLSEHISNYDATDAASGCRCPVAYLGAEAPFANLLRFQEVCPSVKVGQTVGSGHFSPLLVPEQVNAMLKGFERAYIT